MTKGEFWFAVNTYKKVKLMLDEIDKKKILSTCEDYDIEHIKECLGQIYNILDDNKEVSVRATAELKADAYMKSIERQLKE